MRYALERTVAPASEPVSVAQAKAWCRVDSSDDDDLFADLIEEARVYCEDYLHQSLLTQTWRLTFDSWPWHWGMTPRWWRAGGTVWSGTEVIIPRPPLQSVTSITYVDTAGATQTLSNTLYSVDARGMPGRITPAYGQIWPVTRAQINAVTVTFAAGYGADGSSVPATIRSAIKLMVADRYENREQQVTGTIVTELKTGMDRLLSMAAHGSYE